MDVRTHALGLVAKVARRAPEKISVDARLGDLGVGSSIALGILDARLREELGSAPVMTWKTPVREVLAHFAEGATVAPTAAAAAPVRRPATPQPLLPKSGNVIGVGLDVEAVASLPALGDAFYAAHFTPRELERAQQTADAREHLAGLWAAKEAARKAVPDLMKLPVTDLEVRHDADGRPSLAAPASIRVRLHVSISHAAGLATAIVIATE